MHKIREAKHTARVVCSCLLGIALIGCAGIKPATMPNTDIYIGDLDRSALTISNVRNVTNRDGYDNQPSFSTDGNSIYFVSDRSGNGDVYRYLIDSSRLEQVTATAESEFSLTPMSDGKSFSVVRVAKPLLDGEEYTESQQLWRYDLSGRPINAILGTRRVGYHTWVKQDMVALFIVGNEDTNTPHSLVVVDLASRVSMPVAERIGRTIRTTSLGKLLFVDITDTAVATLSAFNHGDEKPTPLLTLPKGSQDFCVLNDDAILLTTPNSIQMWVPGANELISFSITPSVSGDLGRITTTEDGKRIAFVVVRNVVAVK